MKKKVILLAVIGMYLTFASSSPIVLAEDTSEDNEGLGIFTSEISFEVDTEIEEPIQPSQSKEITFKVKYKLNIGPFAKWFFFKRRIGRIIMFGFLQGFFKFLKKLPTANLTLSVEKPEWCQAELDVDVVEFDYNNEFEEAEAKLTLTLNENAPALQKSEVKIIADYLGQGSIGATSNTTTISFMPAYVSNITIEAESELTIPPLKETIIPINITNNGNGESSVNIQILGQENWNITFEQGEITIGVDETKQVIMTVTPPKGFDKVPITLTFVPTSTVEDVDDSYRQGDNVDFSITFYNDGSLKEEEGELDLTTILIIAFVVIIVLILVAVILKKKL